MTAVEFLEKRIEEDSDTSFFNINWDKFDEIIKQAKEMEKEQCLKMLPYDLDELANKEYLDGYDTTNLCRLAFKDGFQKALELLTFKSE